MRPSFCEWFVLATIIVLLAALGVYAELNPPTKVEWRDGCLVLTEGGFTPRTLETIECPGGER